MTNARNDDGRWNRTVIAARRGQVVSQPRRRLNPAAMAALLVLQTFAIAQAQPVDPIGSARATATFGTFRGGEAYRACAPYDGAALRVQLVVDAEREVLLLFNVPASQAAGRWAVGNGHRPRGLSASLCRIDRRAACVVGTKGVLTVERVTATSVVGHRSVILEDGTRLEGPFAVPLKDRGGPACG